MGLFTQPAARLINETELVIINAYSADTAFPEVKDFVTRGRPFAGDGVHLVVAVGGLRSIYSRLADAPGAGSALAPAAVPLTGAGFTPAGLEDVELFDLNKRGNLSLNLRGVGDGAGVGVGLGDA